MWRTTWAEIKVHPSRLVGILLAVGLSVGFVVASLVFVDTEAAAMKRSVAIRTAGSTVVVTPSDDRDLTSLITSTSGVQSVEASRSSWLDFSAGPRSGLLEIDGLPRDPRFRWMTLRTGAWPEQTDEIALGRRTATRFGVAIGQTVRVRVPDAGGATDGSSDQGRATDGPEVVRDLRVVGLVDESASLFAGLQTLGVVAAGSPLLDSGSLDYLVVARPGVDSDVLAARLTRRLPADSTVITSAALADQRLDGLTGGVDVARYLLLAFGSIAALAGAMIISNVLSIVVAQRRRQIGLLRAVGATRRQVRTGLLAEASAAGLVGAMLGVVLGLVIAATAAAWSGSSVAGLVVRPVPVLLAAGAGVVITVVASIAPARRAMLVSPLDALRPVADPSTARRAGRVRAAVTGALALLGIGAVTAGLVRGGSGTMALAIVGSGLVAVAVIGAAPVYLPSVFRTVAWMLRGARPSARLAAANLVRNPARAAAVCSALMLGVGLVVTLQVGAASVKSSTEASVRHEFPVDAIIRNPAGPLPPDVLGQVRALSDVRSAIGVPGVQASAGNGSVRLDGLGADAGSVVAAGLDALDSRTALVHPFTLETIGRSAGDPVTVRVGERSVVLVLRTSDVADAGSLVITTQTLHRLAPDAPVTAVWAAARPGADAATVMSGVRTVAATDPGLEVGGSLQEIAAVGAVLDGLLQIATALTAVAVVIALVGLGNSLSLSVIERGRESALLRALGLQARQLRTMLAAEAILLALVGAGVGVVAGVAFGTVGAAAMAREAGFAETRFAISGAQTITVVLVALAAGGLASVLPGRRAARSRPVEALADL